MTSREARLQVVTVGANAHAEAGGAVTHICGKLAVETAARCGCARDAYTANPACDTPDGITLSWNGREGCGVLVIGYL